MFSFSSDVSPTIQQENACTRACFAVASSAFSDMGARENLYLVAIERFMFWLCDKCSTASRSEYSSADSL